MKRQICGTAAGFQGAEAVRSDQAARPRRGRKPRPMRCVIQLRVREGGKVTSYYSVTVLVKPHEAMKRLQQAFEGDQLH
jgi:hypothetical protein